MLLVTEETLRTCRLTGREAVVCAFSGGPDSTALLLELVRLRDQGRIGPLHAAHFEHGIRGRESRDDLDFSRDLCPAMRRGRASPWRRRRGSSGTGSCGG